MRNTYPPPTVQTDADNKNLWGQSTSWNLSSSFPLVRRGVGWKPRSCICDSRCSVEGNTVLSPTMEQRTRLMVAAAAAAVPSSEVPMHTSERSMVVFSAAAGV